MRAQIVFLNHVRRRMRRFMIECDGEENVSLFSPICDIFHDLHTTDEYTRKRKSSARLCVRVRARATFSLTHLASCTPPASHSPR
jgi:hypothetical protein